MKGLSEALVKLNESLFLKEKQLLRAETCKNQLLHGLHLCSIRGQPLQLVLAQR